MKKYALSLLFLIAAGVAFAQQVRYYNFENTLNEVNGLSPALTILGSRAVLYLIR